MTTEQRIAGACCELVYARVGYGRAHQCGKRAKVIADGLPYCGRHDPAKAAAKKAEREAAWKGARAIADAKHRIASAEIEIALKVAAFSGELPPWLTVARAELLARHAELDALLYPQSAVPIPLSTALPNE